MASTFFGLNIGTSGLYAYQAALNTTAHNVSNAETYGYTRQILNKQAAPAYKTGMSHGMAGSGVVATDVTQIRNSYYDSKFRNNTTIYGGYKIKSDYMKEVENYFNELNGDGFTACFSKLSNSLQELSKDVTSLSVRTQFTQYAQSFSEFFQSISRNLNAVQEGCNTEIKNSAERINSLAEQVATLTKQINTLEVNGASANDLRDTRNVLIDELSALGNITVEERIVGDNVGKTSYEVRLNGQMLVDTTEFNTLNVIPRTRKDNMNDIDGLFDLRWSNGQEFDLASPTLTGTLKSLYEMRDGNNNQNLAGVVSGAAGDTKVTITSTNTNDMKLLNIPDKGVITIGKKEYEYTSFTVNQAKDGSYEYTFELKSEEGLILSADKEMAEIGESINYKGIPYYMAKMNEFVRTFATEFNAIHNAGQDLNGVKGLDIFNATHPVTGENYDFDETGKDVTLSSSYYQMTAGNFTVNEAILKDPSLLALSTDITNGIGNKDNLSKLIACIEDKSMFKQGSPSSFLETLVSEIAIDSKKAETFTANQKNIVSAVANQKLSESGVDIDEEAMNLVTFQNAYNLSAKVIQVMDEVLAKLINEMGV